MGLTLQQTFGINATQSSGSLIINKADLPLLTASENNRAEQLLAAILLHLYLQYSAVLIDENRDFIADEEGNLISALVPPLSDTLVIRYWKKQQIVRQESRYMQDTLVIDMFMFPPIEVNQLPQPDLFP